MCEKSPYLKYLEKHYYSRIKLEKMRDRKIHNQIIINLITPFNAKFLIDINTCKEDAEILKMISKEQKIFNDKIKNLLLSEPHVTTLFEQVGKEKF